MKKQKIPNPVTIDFETQGIKARPEYPPIPCGVSIKYPGKKAHYYAWGHATNNNCTKQAAELELEKAYCWEGGLLFHNSKFDVDVAEVHMGLKLPEWQLIHDTLFLIFLDDPHQMELGLKPSAERILGWGQEEKDAVGEWLLKNQPVPGVKLSKSKASENYYMGYVHYAPGDIVGTYANSDVDKTYDIFKVLWPDIKKRGMLEAYDRERRLMPCLLDMERRGVRVDVHKLHDDIVSYEGYMAKIETWIMKKIQAPYSINLDSSAELMDAMIASKVVNEDQLIMTPTGKVATNKDALLVAVNDKQLLSVLSYRAQLKTCLNTFMKNWLAVAEKPESNGKIFCYFNQVRSDKANDAVGARTGRLSGSPNFLNLPKEFKPLFSEHQKAADRKEKPLPKSPVKGLPALPKCRGYILPFEGEILIGRDFCFTDDTEFLTQDGFKFFDDVLPTDKLAYWYQHTIGFEQPIRRIDKYYEGDMCNMYGPKSIDICVTADHDMVLLGDRWKKDHYKVKAIDIPFGDGRKFLPQAGRYSNVTDIEESKMILLAAFQADGALKTVSTGRTLFKFSKERKITRLLTALRLLEVPFKLSERSYKCDGFKKFTWVSLYMPDWVWGYISKTQEKTFTRQILTLPEFFIEEVKKWDGTNNLFMSTNKTNIELVQELCVLRNRFAHIHIAKIGGYAKKDGSDKKVCYELKIHALSGTYIKTQSNVISKYQGRVVCFEMPHGTLVLRRKGKPFVAGNCGQELRMLAHLTDATMAEAYRENPRIDLHQYAVDLILKEAHVKISRYAAKTISFAILYGAGVGKLAESLGCTVDEAVKLKKAYLKAFPEIERLQKDLKQRGKSNQPYYTVGGRQYYDEPKKQINGRVIDFNYKATNFLCQGGSSDQTKEAVIKFYESGSTAQLILIVHDELVISSPQEDVNTNSQVLNDAMVNAIELGVPMLTDGERGFNWGEMSDEEV